MEKTVPQILIGWTTVPDEPTALALAEAVLAAGAAACAQVSGPVKSLYRWEGELCRDAEYRVAFKFAAAAESRLRAVLLANHPYKMPQWLAVPASCALPQYAEWVAESCVATEEG